jgi:hypothetical protein
MQQLAGLFRRHENIGNFPPFPGVYPNYPAPVIRNVDGGRELAMVDQGPSTLASGDQAPGDATGYWSGSGPLDALEISVWIKAPLDIGLEPSRGARIEECGTARGNEDTRNAAPDVIRPLAFRRLVLRTGPLRPRPERPC